MANILSKANYIKISDYYADLRAQLNSSVHYLYDAAYTIVLLNDFEPSIDLQNPTYNVYINQTSSIQSNSAFIEAVRAVNNHVIRRSGSTSLNQYLFNNTIQVDQNWADMSADAGFTIDDDYIL